MKKIAVFLVATALVSCSGSKFSTNQAPKTPAPEIKDDGDSNPDTPTFGGGGNTNVHKGTITPSSTLKLGNCEKIPMGHSTQCAEGTVAKGIGYLNGPKLECCQVQDSLGNAMELTSKSDAVTQSWLNGSVSCAENQFITGFKRVHSVMTLHCAELSSGAYVLKWNSSSPTENYVVKSNTNQFQTCSNEKLITKLSDTYAPDLDIDYIDCKGFFVGQ